ncbi:class II aldolase/adducin family protein [Sphingomonas sp.]|uniref:class II aldolase/adducin family protein n=1 Tax=Sphingomonas sp. TaxID=28214 RepID=UPI000DB5E887|nr:class II aldolase/adducin family protein [Sphingomonas sp.]PZU06494.1 MAG: class II aldolase [Sphingomonas sp.]
MASAALHAIANPSIRDYVSDAEWQARVDLAAAYRLCDRYGMSDMIYTHISARVPDEPNAFLINSHGLLFDEMTASSLLKVDMDGNVLTKPLENHGLHPAGFVIHSALYIARPDIGAAMHTHTTAGLAIASLKCGLLPLTQMAHRFIDHVAYHDFSGPERDPGEREKLAADLGDKKVAILRNHGLLSVGPTVAEAFNYMYGLERACQAQAAAMACNTELNILPDDVVEKSTAMYAPGAIRRYGLLEWEGLLRKLDRLDPSYRD